jgi:AraC-like DNA-binding protein
MTFEQRLYEQVCRVLPKTTTRTFSRDCGMSDNYLCSIQSQRLHISTAALLHLAEILEHRRTLGQTKKSIDPVLQMLADEIAERSNHISSSSFAVQRLVAKAMAAAAYKRDCVMNAPTISMGWL